MTDKKKQLNDEEIELVGGSFGDGNISYTGKYKEGNIVQYNTYDPIEKKWVTFVGKIITHSSNIMVVIYAIQRASNPDIIDAVLEEHVICKLS